MWGLDWPGRNEAFGAAFTPINSIMTHIGHAGVQNNVAQNTDSENTDSENIVTQNMLIEGDNLEALKHLRTTHTNAVKLVYIDPPYNTGNEFVYNDSFAGTHFEGEDPGGTAMNHDAWLSMMTPRLVLARELLRDDGVIMISIDSGELAHLQLLMAQIFGERNSLGTIVWASNLKGRQIGVSGPCRTHEYIVLYARDITKVGSFTASAAYLSEIMPTVYQNVTYPVKHDKIGPYVIKNQLYNTNSRFNEQTARTMVYAIDYHPDSGRVLTRDIVDGVAVGQVPGSDWVTIMPHRNHREGIRFHAWRWSRARVERDSHELEFRFSRGAWRIFTKVRDVDRIVVKDLVVGPSTMSGIKDLQKLGLGEFFSYPKPVALLQMLVEAASGKDDLVVDFFAGSGTTAQAVAVANAHDGGSRRWVLVQLDEPLKRNVSGADKYRTIADVTRARLNACGLSYRDYRIEAY